MAGPLRGDELGLLWPTRLTAASSVRPEFVSRSVDLLWDLEQTFIPRVELTASVKHSEPLLAVSRGTSHHGPTAISQLTFSLFRRKQSVQF